MTEFINYPKLVINYITNETNGQVTFQELQKVLNINSLSLSGVLDELQKDNIIRDTTDPIHEPHKTYSEENLKANSYKITDTAQKLITIINNH